MLRVVTSGSKVTVPNRESLGPILSVRCNAQCLIEDRFVRFLVEGCILRIESEHAQLACPLRLRDEPVVQFAPRIWSRPVHDGSLSEQLDLERQDDVPPQAQLRGRRQGEEIGTAGRGTNELAHVIRDELPPQRAAHVLDAVRRKPRRFGAARVDATTGQRRDQAGTRFGSKTPKSESSTFFA